MVIDNNTSVATRFWTLGEHAVGALDHIKPLAQLGARWYVASVFFRSRLTKLHDWDTTLALFTDEYHVPLLNPTVAAYLATGAELGLSTLLVLGMFGRFAAAGLSVLNVVAVISLAEVADAALTGHVFWGSLLGFLMLWGPGPLSLDHGLIARLRRWVIKA